MLVEQVEYLHVDEEHEHQGGQHAAQEVEVHHVVHADDVLKGAGDLGPAAQRAVGLPPVPAQ